MNITELLIVKDVDADFTDTTELVAGVGTITNLDFTTAEGTDVTVEDIVVTDLATINKIDANQIDAEDANLGVTTIASLRVTGITTFEGVVNIDNVEFVDESVTGVASINTLKFNTGFGTFLQVTDSVTGIATIGLGSITRIESDAINVYEANIGVATVGYLTVTDGMAVTGPTSFVGFTTYTGDVFINGDLTVTGVTTFNQLDAVQSQIGILTVSSILDGSTADAVFQTLQVTESTELLGVSTVSGSEFENGDATIARNFYVTGITTFQEAVNIDKVEFVELSVTGIASIDQLYLNSGIATQISIGLATITDAQITDLSVSGLSTFVGFSTFQGDVHISQDLEVTRDVNVGSSLTVPNLTYDTATGQHHTITEAIIGIATISQAVIVQEQVGDSQILRANIEDLISSRSLNLLW